MQVHLAHGSDIVAVPAGAFLHEAPMSVLNGKASGEDTYGYLAIVPSGASKGHVVVFSDSNCLDSSHQNAPCYDFLSSLLERVVEVSCSRLCQAHTNAKPCRQSAIELALKS
jgi:membrane-bound transcription factor site-1 protease